MRAPRTTDDNVDAPHVAELLLSIPDAGRRLGLSRSTSYQAVRLGQLPTLRLGGRLYVPVARLEELLGKPLTPVSAEERAPSTTGATPTKSRAPKKTSATKATKTGTVPALPGSEGGEA